MAHTEALAHSTRMHALVIDMTAPHSCKELRSFDVDSVPWQALRPSIGAALAANRRMTIAPPSRDMPAPEPAGDPTDKPPMKEPQPPKAPVGDPRPQKPPQRDPPPPRDPGEPPPEIKDPPAPGVPDEGPALA